jgi:hypothetical protein
MKMTWGAIYWPIFLIGTSLTFLGPELYALFTNWKNTLSDYSWTELHVSPGITVHTVAWYISLIAWLLVVVVLTLHIWWEYNP